MLIFCVVARSYIYSSVFEALVNFSHDIILFLLYRQMYLAYSYTDNAGPLQRWKIYAFQLFTVFTYANSAINPVIYGFTNDFFKKSFRNIFGCPQPTSTRRGGTVPNENGTVATRLRSTQCRPSRRRMTTLSDQPDLFLNSNLKQF